MSGCVLRGSAKQCLIMTCHQDVGCTCLNSLFIEQEQYFEAATANICIYVDQSLNQHSLNSCKNNRTAGSVLVFAGQRCSLPAAAFQALGSESLRPPPAPHYASVLHAGPKHKKTHQIISVKGECIKFWPSSALPLPKKLLQQTMLYRFFKKAL